MCTENREEASQELPVEEINEEVPAPEAETEAPAGFGKMILKGDVKNDE